MGVRAADAREQRVTHERGGAGLEGTANSRRLARTSAALTAIVGAMRPDAAASDCPNMFTIGPIGGRAR